MGAPEPHQEWSLCKPCQQALFVEMRRSSIRSPIRLRIAMGLVAAERSPKAHVSTPLREQQVFQREFSWFIWLMVLFGILHLVIFVIIFTVHK
jgi:hypothetical protein